MSELLSEAPKRDGENASVPEKLHKIRTFFLFGDRTDGLTEQKKILFWVWNILCLLGSACVLCLVTLLLAYGPYSADIFRGYFEKPLILLLNFLPIFLLQLLLFGVCGRQWLSFLLTSLLFVVASVSNYYKLTLRNDPVVFADLAVMFTAADFAGHYTLEIGKQVVLAVCTVPLGTLFLLLCARGKISGKCRIILLLAAVLPLYPLWALVYSQKSVFNSSAMRNPRCYEQFTQTQQMVARGFVYSAVNSAAKVYEPIPADYDEQAVAAVLSGYTDADIPDGKKVNILAIQLEAFSDFEALGIEGIDASAYADYKQVRAQSYSGTLITNIFTGGTIDTERCFVTGAAGLHNYTENTPSYVWYLKSQGYQTLGSHPATKIFYDREHVNAYLGFEKYYYTENCFEALTDTPTAGDDILFPELLRQFTEAMEDGPAFDFSVSYQGHGPYDTQTLTANEVLWSGEGYSDTAYYALNNYLESVKNTGKNLLWLTEQLSECEKPVILVLYGDHKPWMGNDACVYKELGVSFDFSTQAGVENYYGTEYLIWANEAAKKLTGFDYCGNAPTVSAGFLMNEVFDTLGWGGPAYMQYTEQLRKTFPVITSLDICYGTDGLTYEFTEEEQAMLTEFECVQYYRHRAYGKVS